jgi:hypothetical protein
MLSRHRALAELRALGRALEGVSAVDVRERVSNELYHSLLHHFGSLDEARMAAGVAAPQPKNKRWDPETVVTELRHAHRAGVRLTNHGLIKAGLRGLSNAARQYCGGLPQARKLAGLAEPARALYERVAWDEDTIISDIRALHREGKSLAYSQAPSKLVSAATYRFGSWEGAVECAGFDYDRVRLDAAIRKRRPEAGLLHHSDRGSQYTSEDYRAALCALDVSVSMSRKGNCWDNAVAESFFSTLKLELIHRRTWRDVDDVRQAVFEYIEVFYNRRRLHSSLGYKPPALVEKEYAQAA